MRIFLCFTGKVAAKFCISPDMSIHLHLQLFLTLPKLTTGYFVYNGLVRLAAGRVTALHFISPQRLYPHAHIVSDGQNISASAIFYACKSPAIVTSLSALVFVTTPLRVLRLTLGMATSPSRSSCLLHVLACGLASRARHVASALAGSTKKLPAGYMHTCFWSENPLSIHAVLAGDVISWWGGGLTFALVATVMEIWVQRESSTAAVRYPTVLVLVCATLAAGITSFLLGVVMSMCDVLGALSVRDTKVVPVDGTPGLVPSRLTYMVHRLDNGNTDVLILHTNPTDVNASSPSHGIATPLHYPGDLNSSGTLNASRAPSSDRVRETAFTAWGSTGTDPRNTVPTAMGAAFSDGSSDDQLVRHPTTGDHRFSDPVRSSCFETVSLR
eukprot:m.1024976 g.1024976  ORF g.1024976 m.1024976 type:complete len:385 (-) comp24103_c0_seq3:1531-2685(-)